MAAPPAVVEEEGGALGGAWGGEEVGLRVEADRNMSCQGGVGVVEVSSGSEYGTSSIAGAKRERREKVLVFG